jgi:hypothetical protein
MARRIAQSVGARSTLSYIDMISGGFGAAFFLFLIFVSFPIETSSTPSNGSRFLDIWLTWGVPDVSVYTVVEFTPEGRGLIAPAPRLYSLNSRAMRRNSRTGEVMYSGRDAPFWTYFAEAGYSSGGERGMRQSDGTQAGQWLRFSDPCPGFYRILVAGQSPRDLLLDLLIEARAPEPVPGQVRVIVSDGGAPLFLPVAEAAAATMDFTLGGAPQEVPLGGMIEISGDPGASQASFLHCDVFN